MQTEDWLKAHLDIKETSMILIEWFKAYDVNYGDAIDAEAERQQQEQYWVDCLWAIVSKAVMAAQGTLLTNKYAEAIQVNVTMVVRTWLMWLKSLAIERAKNFGAKFCQQCNLTQVAKPMLLFTCH